MGKPDAPQPTDPKETSAAQTGTNVSTAIANAMMGNVNQITPQGTLSYNQTGSYKWTDPYTEKTYDVPTFTATQTYSPAQQAMMDQNQAAQTNLAGLANQQSSFLKNYMAQPLSIADMGAAPTLGALKTSYDAPNTQQVQDALMARMQPGLDRDRTALETKLSNMGLKAGSSAWQDAMNTANQQTNDARMAAILSAGQEQTRLSALNKDQAAFANQGMVDQYNAAMGSRTQQLQERTALRNQPINEITALISGSQVQNPNWVNTQMPKIPTTDNAGIIANYDDNMYRNWQAETAGTNSLLGGLMGGVGQLGGAWIMKSDERVKEDKRKIGKLEGQNIYEFRYKGDPTKRKHVGVIAQEVEKARPDVVRKDSKGVRSVNYGKLFKAGVA